MTTLHTLEYQVIEGWEKLPEGLTHRDVPDVAVDSHDRVYLLTRGEPRVMIYERDGTFVTSWGEGALSAFPHSITVGPEGSVYCVDEGEHTVKKFSPDGRLLMTLGTAGVPSETGYDRNIGVESVAFGGPPFNRPADIFVAPNGDLWVCDGYGNARVHQFSADGQLIQSWGEPGIGPGQFNIPHAIWLTNDERIVVADRENDRLQFFTPDGKFLEQWTDLQRPCGLVVDSEGLYYVAELMWPKGEKSLVNGVAEEHKYGRVSIFSPKGELLARWGSLDFCAPGSFIAPHGICVDSHGDLYVAEVTGQFGVRRGLVPPDCHTLQKFERR